MKKLLSLIILFSSLLYLSSCSDNDLITETSSDGVDNISLLKGGGISANGQAALFFDDNNNIVSKEDGARQNFSFHARIDKNGDVSGSIQSKARNEGSNTKAHGVITCMQVYDHPSGKVAAFSGYFTSLETDFPGINIDVTPYFYFKVLDGGEGNNTGDYFTDVYLWFNEVDCEQLGLMTAYLSNNGNVQVKSE